jgi:hypothetical protein
MWGPEARSDAECKQEGCGAELLLRIERSNGRMAWSGGAVLGPGVVLLQQQQQQPSAAVGYMMRADFIIMKGCAHARVHEHSEHAFVDLKHDLYVANVPL